MRVRLLVIGRAGVGPEAALAADYLKRFDAAGRKLSLGPSSIVELEDKRRRGASAESGLILDAAAPGPLLALDERGDTVSSREFAKKLATWRDQGARTLNIAIGGADGHDPALRAKADTVLSFGPMVWPHMLARAMLAEQLYRAASILSGAPYHRD